MVEELSEMFHIIESTTNKMLKADANLERTLTVPQSMEKVCAQFCKLYHEKARSAQTAPGNYY